MHDCMTLSTESSTCLSTTLLFSLLGRRRCRKLISRDINFLCSRLKPSTLCKVSKDKSALWLHLICQTIKIEASLPSQQRVKHAKNDTGHIQQTLSFFTTFLFGCKSSVNNNLKTNSRLWIKVKESIFLTLVFPNI